MAITLHKGDLPKNLDFGPLLAVDTETMGLNLTRDKLCLVQLSSGDGHAHLVQLDRDTYHAPVLKKLLADKKTTKIFHFARFDVAMIKHYLKVDCTPIYCTRTASRLVRTYTDSHGLREVCRELAGIDLSKHQQSSDWGASQLTKEQQTYAAHDVLYLHQIKERLDEMLKREGRTELARKCFEAIATISELDLNGWDETLFAHSTAR